MQRVFHPIGQGAFYSERHEGFNMVYDCGNWKNTKLSDRIVTQAFDKSEQTFANINQIVDQESITRNRLENTLNELSRAAKSFRVFTEYLEQHPEALIKGKKY